MDLKVNHIAPILTELTSVNQPCSSSELLDDACSTSWLDAMKSSSPRNNIIKNKDSEFSKELAYRDYTVKYPSALTSIEQIVTNAKGKKIALFLDYDGTLSPIVDNPDLAFMSDAMRDAVRNVAKYIPTAIVSGRSRAKVYKFVGLKELHYAGSHGMDISGPVQGSVYQLATELLPTIKEAFVSLVEIMKNIEGAYVEDNMFSVSVHYRNVDEKNWEPVARYAKDTLKNYPKLRLTHGRMVLEVRPMLEWNKGKAVEFLLESLGLSNRDDVLPIYIGDDKTDEDAFKYLSQECGRGYGILVTPAPRETSAYYSLRDPSEVMEFINLLANSVS